MIVTDFIKQIKKVGIKTLTGVPDSALRPFCDYINGVGKEEFTHYVPANEGAAVGIAIGEYLSTGVPACVYMQNSGLGNIVNPITSLANEEVYGIRCCYWLGTAVSRAKRMNHSTNIWVRSQKACWMCLA